RWITVAVGDGSVAKPVARLFDAVVMSGHIRTGNRVVRGDVHIGCALGDGRVLHTEPVTGPQIMALDDPRIIKRVKGVYRPQVLEEKAAAGLRSTSSTGGRSSQISARCTPSCRA